jgi:hypothetical protein
MADEQPAPTAAAAADNEAPAAEASTPAAEQGHPPSAHSTESPTKNVLREAIDKVKAEIAHHESEAQQHMQQAEALRKDLRECFRFLQSGGREGLSEPASERPAASPGEPAPLARPREASAAPRQHRSRGKKKRAGRRSREA